MVLTALADYQMAIRASNMAPTNPAPVGAKQRLLFMGQKRSGKSSIINVVLYRLPPTDTIFIPATLVIKKHTLYSFRNFQIWDLPGQLDFLDPSFDTDGIYGNAGAMVWVLDAQDEYLDSIARLTDTILNLQQSHPEIKYTVFIHKVDSLTNDYREDTVRDIIQRIMDDLNDAGLENPPINFYSTSVYDESIYEALSKVVQMLNPQLPTFENMLNTISSSCKFQKLYLFDVMTKLYIASDTSPADQPSYAVCADFIDTIVDLSQIYGWNRDRAKAQKDDQTGEVSTVEDPPPDKADTDESCESCISGAGPFSIYLKEMNKHLALIGISKEERFMQEKPTIEYNVQLFQDSLAQVLAVTSGQN